MRKCKTRGTRAKRSPTKANLLHPPPPDNQALWFFFPLAGPVDGPGDDALRGLGSLRGLRDVHLHGTNTLRGLRALPPCLTQLSFCMYEPLSAAAWARGGALAAELGPLTALRELSMQVTVPRPSTLGSDAPVLEPGWLTGALWPAFARLHTLTLELKFGSRVLDADWSYLLAEAECVVNATRAAALVRIRVEFGSAMPDFATPAWRSADGRWFERRVEFGSVCFRARGA